MTCVSLMVGPGQTGSEADTSGYRLILVNNQTAVSEVCGRCHCTFGPGAMRDAGLGDRGEKGDHPPGRESRRR